MSAAALLELAKKRFGDSLTDADGTLFRETANGEVAYYGEGDPAEADNWGEDRVLRADRIEWFCSNREAAHPQCRNDRYPCRPQKLPLSRMGLRPLPAA